MIKSNPFPFHLSLAKVSYAPPKISEGLTLFLVLSGSLQVITAKQKYQLQTDDLLVINPLQQYQLKSTDKNLFLSLRISRKQLIPDLKDNWMPGHMSIK